MLTTHTGLLIGSARLNIWSHFFNWLLFFSGSLWMDTFHFVVIMHVVCASASCTVKTRTSGLFTKLRSCCRTSFLIEHVQHFTSGSVSGHTRENHTSVVPISDVRGTCGSTKMATRNDHEQWEQLKMWNYLLPGSLIAFLWSICW